MIVAHDLRYGYIAYILCVGNRYSKSPHPIAEKSIKVI